MKRLLVIFLMIFALVACTNKNGIAPKEGRQSIVVPAESIKKTKVKIEPVPNRKVSNWLSAYANSGNNRPSTVMKKAVTLKKEISIGRGINDDHQVMAGPIVVRGVVYTLDGDFNLQATGLKTGEKLWRKSLLKIEGTPFKSIGLSSDRKNIYAVAGNGSVIAVDMQGNQKWIQDLKIPLRSAPSVAENRLFVSSINNDLFALDAKTGKILWKQNGERSITNFFGMGAPAVSGFVVIMPTTNGIVKAFDVATGVLLWTENMWTNKTFSPMLDIPHMTAAPVIDGKNVYLIGNAGKSGSYRVENGTPLFTVGVGGRDTPVVGGNALYLISNKNQLWALDKKQGRQFWVTSLSGSDKHSEKVTWYGPVLMWPFLMLTSSEGDIVYYEAETGKEKHREKQSPLVGAPVFSDGYVLFLTTNGKLLIYQ